MTGDFTVAVWLKLNSGLSGAVVPFRLNAGVSLVI